MKIAVIDYNMGNLRSVLNAFEKIGTPATIEKKAENFKKYDKIVLPGVGAFADAMAHLKEYGMIESILEFAKSGKYMLGICLGMQLLFEKSYEFCQTEGLKLIKGEVVRFDKTKFKKRLKVPHMGWNMVFANNDSALFEGLPKDFYLYFVHSYHAVTSKEYIIGNTLYGYEFASAVNRDNIFGLQPHPEKSHDFGLKILENFVQL